MKRILRHVGLVHAHDPHFHVVCGMEGCCRSYSNFLSYKKHLYRKHRMYLDHSSVTLDSSISLEDRDIAVNVSEDNIDIFNESAALMHLEDTNMAQSSSAQDEHSDSHERNHCALLLLKMKQSYKMSEKAVDEMIEDITSLIQLQLDKARQSLLSSIPQEMSIINECTTFQSPFSGLETKHLRRKYLFENLN